MNVLRSIIITIIRSVLYSKLLWNIASLPLLFVKVKRNRVMLVCRGGSCFNCNPQAIAEHLVNNSDNEWDVVVGLQKGVEANGIPAGAKVARIGTLEYYKQLYSSRFFMTNEMFRANVYWQKRRGQLFVHTLHGGHGIKKVAFDKVEGPADPYKWIYVGGLMDLSLSNSEYMTKYIIRSGFRFREMPVLECGLPRNDIFFRKNVHAEIKKKVFSDLGLPANAHLVIYGPTFRYHGGYADAYMRDFRKVLEAFSTRFGGEWYMGVSRHPYIRQFYKDLYDFSQPSVIDVGEYPNTQHLLVAADALISDFSSIEMDMSLLGKPVFQLIKDLDEQLPYTYMNPQELPFPLAETEEKLCQEILSFDEERYKTDLMAFNRDVIKLKENGTACEQLEQWMISKM